MEQEAGEEEAHPGREEEEGGRGAEAGLERGHRGGTVSQRLALLASPARSAGRPPVPPEPAWPAGQG